MTVSPSKLLKQLPANTSPWVLVKERQTVPDIIDLICEKHKEFAADYDVIGEDFAGGTIDDICDNLYYFCKKNIRYVEEKEAFQSVGNPASILERRFSGVDCKSYALFIGGCLDAIKRNTGQQIDWFYRFASYEPGQRIPYHVFICVNTPGGLVYVDPTPGSEDKEPVWIIDERITLPGQVASVNQAGELVTGFTVGAVDPSWGTLMPVPAWYPSHLPRYYNNGNGVFLRPLNSVPKYTDSDVLDTAIYLQTIIGYNRIDWKNARYVSWYHRDGWPGGGELWIKFAFRQEGNETGGGDHAAIPFDSVSNDNNFRNRVIARYVEREKAARPWLVDMQNFAGGIDLITIPAPNDREVQRPSWYSKNLPSLFYAAGNMGQYPAGHLDTKPKMSVGKSGSFPGYQVTALDVAQYMVYAQPEIYNGQTPYPLNWYVNDFVNGAMASYFKLTLNFTEGHTNSQMQEYGIWGNILRSPDLDANPFASGFTQTLQTIVSLAINFFAGKVPGGAKLLQSAYTAGNISAGEFITGGEVPPGQWSAAVFAAAETLYTKQAAAEGKKNMLIAGGVLAAGLLWYYWDDIKKMKL